MDAYYSQHSDSWLYLWAGFHYTCWGSPGKICDVTHGNIKRLMAVERASDQEKTQTSTI
jgi:hypothetical protein